MQLVSYKAVRFVGRFFIENSGFRACYPWQIAARRRNVTYV